MTYDEGGGGGGKGCLHFSITVVLGGILSFILEQCEILSERCTNPVHCNGRLHSHMNFKIGGGRTVHGKWQ